MARIFITGSADGLGHLAARKLIGEGHQVVLHGRNAARAREALKKLPGAEKALAADLSNIQETKKLAEELNASGPFDAIIHNAGVYQAAGRLLAAVNVLAPYILTCMVQKPRRLIYMGSGMHLSGHAQPDNLPDRISYSDSKLFVLMLSMAVARKWPDVLSNTVNPGWVPTKMGGAGAPDDIDKGAETQAWLAVSTDEKAMVSGRYFHHQKEDRARPEASDAAIQDKFLFACEKITGVSLPVNH